MTDTIEARRAAAPALADAITRGRAMLREHAHVAVALGGSFIRPVVDTEIPHLPPCIVLSRWKADDLSLAMEGKDMMEVSDE